MILDGIFIVTGVDKERGETSLSTRCFGWFPSDKLASMTIERDDNVMHDLKYLWIVMEEYHWGILPLAKSEKWWEWVAEDGEIYCIRGCWERCERPKGIPEQIMNWGIA